MRIMTSRENDANGKPMEGLTSANFKGTATHATAAAVTVAAVLKTRHVVCGVTASSDKAGSLLQIKQGTTVIWDVQVGSGHYEHNFGGAFLVLDENTALVVAIDGTSLCKANVHGYTVTLL